ncbi:hypothetical protein [Vibrio metoecus]|uniref:Uncharacterized protein n=1 Tax=Vibrio metoecus TaxID=1481663 RepID=A0A271VLP0_VIBMT|nr:hypothetical protein [Vibrio metoecus]KQB06578.1 hypothetical protein XV94_17440 [Vibrio metoecus]PAR19073.1 hypothetical protein CGU03_17575 [Vibrio metoecus]PAR20364.1 hypothetical protein CGU02_18085 [Vibrio metoecus]PAR33951.1 hypothetical protein CGT97_18565 [Vibrio metoecus]PAR42032.1 hypothetical protein CGT96_14390 [Vibrio metoecus]
MLIRYYLHELDAKLRYNIESSTNISLSLERHKVGTKFSLYKKGNLIAEIQQNSLFFFEGSIQKIRVDTLVDAWEIGEEKTRITISGGKYYQNEILVGQINHGGSILHSIHSFLTGKGWVKPRIYSEIEFDENVIRPEYALGILVADTVME